MVGGVWSWLRGVGAWGGSWYQGGSWAICSWALGCVWRGRHGERTPEQGGAPVAGGLMNRDFDFFLPSTFFIGEAVRGRTVTYRAPVTYRTQAPRSARPARIQSSKSTWGRTCRRAPHVQKCTKFGTKWYNNLDNIQRPRIAHRQPLTHTRTRTRACTRDAPQVDSSGAIKYDGSLVGRRCTALWSPPDDGSGSGSESEEGYYAATVVAFNSRCSEKIGRFLLHFDDGQRERVELPDPTVRIVTMRVDWWCSRLDPSTSLLPAAA